MERPGDTDRALLELAALRDSLRDSGNRERAGRFSCDGCVSWCCREGFNSMRATPLEAEAILRLLEERGGIEEGLDRAREAVERWRLGDDAPGRTYTCPFLTAGSRCGVHGAKPLGCVTFTPVRDGGCDQDGDRLAAALERAAVLNDRALRGEGWEPRPLPAAILEAAYRFFPRATKQSRQ